MKEQIHWYLGWNASKESIHGCRINLDYFLWKALRKDSLVCLTVWLLSVVKGCGTFKHKLRAVVDPPGWGPWFLTRCWLEANFSLIWEVTCIPWFVTSTSIIKASTLGSSPCRALCVSYCQSPALFCLISSIDSFAFIFDFYTESIQILQDKSLSFKVSL